MTTAHATIAIRAAEVDEAGRVANLLAAAFHQDPVSCWLLPDPADRARRHPAFFQIFVEHALTWGQIYLAGDDAGAALWLDVEPDEGILSDAATGVRLRAALGPSYDRFTHLDRRMQRAHPTELRHLFLPFIGVLPDRQGQGIGGALLRHRLAEADRAGVFAYLEASSPRSLDLYRRFGYEPLPRRIRLPGGPTLYPMWRPPPDPRRRPANPGPVQP